MTFFDSLNSFKAPDFNGDGRTDLFSFDLTTRIPEINLSANIRTSASSPIFFIPEGWQTPKYGDFNQDGKTDLVWRNPKTGENAIWLMDGTSSLDAQWLDSLQGTWTEVVGDFDGNGTSDLFWYNSTTGEFQIWAINGAQRVKRSIGQIEPGWEPAATNFTSDHRHELFWRNPLTGQNAVWTIDPQTLSTSGEWIETKSPTWNYEMIDYNGDGRSDLLWRDRLTGQNQIWLWTSDSLQPDPIAIDLPSTSSDFVIKTGDFDGNHKTDFLVRNPSTGENQIWRAGDIEVQISDIPAQSATFFPEIGDYNGDRFSDIRWVSVTGQENVIWFSDGKLPQSIATD